MGDSVGGGDVALYTAQTLQEYRDTRDVYYTHVHQDIRESLDHILVSEQFYDNGKKRLWLFDGMAVNNDHLNFDDHKADGTNDHGIIRAVFKHKPIQAGVAEAQSVTRSRSRRPPLRGEDLRSRRRLSSVTRTLQSALENGLASRRNRLAASRSS